MNTKELAEALSKSMPEAPVLVKVAGKYYEVISVTVPLSEGLSALIGVLEPTICGVEDKK